MSKKKKKRTAGNPARRNASFAARVALRDYEGWARDVAGVTEQGVDREVALLEDLFELAAAHRITLLEPLGTAMLCDVIVEMEPEDADTDSLMETLDKYLHFRMDTDPESGWARAHDLVEEAIESAMEDPFDMAGTLSDAIATSGAIPPEQRLRALADLSIVSGARGVLEWMGKGRPITETGALRRADIAPVAAMIGVNAVGAAKRAPQPTDSGTVQVATMWELLPLSAWWEALQVVGILETTASRVRPGEEAGPWLADELPPLESADMVAGMFVAEVLMSRLRDDDPIGAEAFRRSIDLVLDALDGWDAKESVSEDDFREWYIEMLAKRALVELEQRGLLVTTDAGGLSVPAELAGTVARGVGMAVTMAEVIMTDDDETDAGVAASTDDPFADPDVRAEMARLGVVHKPGMARQLLEELAPLLAEEGIDLDDLEETDLDRFNEALGHAQERHNLELFTPVGASRARAITVLRLLSEALAEGSDAVAQIVLEGIPSDPEPDRPSVAQVIGVGLGFLDGWHGASALGAGVARARLAEWDPAGQAAAKDILGHAGRGQAFDALRELIATHAGRAVLHGTALAVSASVAVRAARDGAGLRETAEQMLDA